MKVEDLEDMAEGFSNAFEESSKVEISAQIDKIYATQFDSDFGNIPVKAEITINFSNPINNRFLAAKAQIYFKGTAEVQIIDNFVFTFKITQEKVKVQSFTPYFFSETTLADFEEEYMNAFSDKILLALNKRYAQGVPLPLGADLNQSTGPVEVTIFKDYILAEMKG